MLRFEAEIKLITKEYEVNRMLDIEHLNTQCLKSYAIHSGLNVFSALGSLQGWHIPKNYLCRSWLLGDLWSHLNHPTCLDQTSCVPGLWNIIPILQTEQQPSPWGLSSKSITLQKLSYVRNQHIMDQLWQKLTWEEWHITWVNEALLV